jgi:hypothetical protein
MLAARTGLSPVMVGRAAELARLREFAATTADRPSPSSAARPAPSSSATSHSAQGRSASVKLTKKSRSILTFASAQLELFGT